MNYAHIITCRRICVEGCGSYFHLSLSTPMRPEDGDSVQSTVAAQNTGWSGSMQHSWGSFFFLNIGALRIRWKHGADRIWQVYGCKTTCRIKSRLIALLLRVACISYGKARRALEIFFHIEAVIALFASIYCFHLSTVQSSVKTFLPGFGNDRLKYCVIVHFWGG